LIIGLDSDGRMYVLEEFYERGMQVQVLFDWLKDKKQIYNFAAGYGDPSEPQFIIMANHQGLNMREADNAVLPGIDAVFKALNIQPDGKPRLYVHERCKHTIEEFGKYRYKDSKEGVAKQENPLKVDDHAMDAIRYGLKTHKYGNKGYVILEDKEGVFFT